MNNDFASTKKSRWMLVDDNTEILSLLTALVESLTDAEVECHNSAQSALSAFAAAPGRYELVITDYEMPGVDGVELCRQMIALSPTQKILLATGSGFFTEAVARHAGFTGLLAKPFPIETLRETLDKAGITTETLAHA